MSDRTVGADARHLVRDEQIMSRGFTLLELLIAMVAGSIVLLGVGSVLVMTIRQSNQNTSQAFLQRQAAWIIMEELRRQVPQATALERGTCPVAAPQPQSLRVTNSAGIFCFYQSGSQLQETRDGGTPQNLLSGSPVALSVTNFTTTLTTEPTGACCPPGACPLSGACPPCGPGASCRATVTFTLQDNVPNAMTFSVDLAKRN